jgi:MFS family permease
MKRRIVVSDVKRKAPLIIAILALSFIVQCNDTTSVIMGSLVQEFPDQSPVAIQFLMQMGMVAAFIVSLIVGFLTRIFRIKSMLLIGAALQFFGGIAPMFMHGSLYILYVFAFVVGAGHGFMPPLLGAVILQNFEGKAKDRMVGLNITFNTLGSAILLAIAGPLVAMAWTNVYYIYFICVPVFIIGAILMPKGEKAPPPPADEKSKVPVPLKGWIQAIMVVLMYICYVTFPLNVGMYIEGEGLGDPTATSGAMILITIISAVIGVIFQPVIKYVKLFVGSFAAIFGFAGLLLVVLSTNIPMIYAASALLGIYFGMMACSHGYIISRICKPEEFAPTFGVFTSFVMVGVILSPLIISPITALWGGVGPKAVFITATVGFGIVTVIQLIWNIYLTRVCPPEKMSDAA